MLQNPQQFFSLRRNSRIVFCLLSVTKAAVRDTGFGTAVDLMSDSPYFVEKCGFDSSLAFSDGLIEVKRLLSDGRPCRVYLTAGSQPHHLIGRNVLGVALDEANFRLDKDPELAAHQFYADWTTRMQSRFQKSCCFSPTISIIASSAGNESTFTENVINEINVKNEPRRQVVYRGSIYGIKPGVVAAGQRWFKVCYGIKNSDPCVLAGWYQGDGTPVEDEHHEFLPAGATMELVPEQYHDAFRRDCRGALQSLSGISVGGSHRFFASMTDIERCLEISANEGVINPVHRGIERIPLSTGDGRNIWDYLNHRTFLGRNSGRIVPLRHPERLRFAHMDLAVSSMAGIAICHLVGRERVDGLVKEGAPFSEYRLIVEYDFILTIIPGDSGAISFEKIQNFFLWLRDECGYRFGLITADMYQSKAPLQILESRGLDVGELSTDRDKSVYISWRAGFQERCIRLFRQKQLLTEAECLLELERKVDHPPTVGSKDTTDAAAGCFYNAVNSDERFSIFSSNEPAIYGLGATPSVHQDELDFNFVGDYLRRSPRPIRKFTA